MRANDIAFLAKIEQRCLRIDSRDDAINGEEFCGASEKRFVISIETETFVTVQPAEVEEVTRAAAKIEDVQRWRPIKPEILDALYIHTYPVVRVFVGIDLSRVRPRGIIFAQSQQFRLINRA